MELGPELDEYMKSYAATRPLVFDFPFAVWDLFCPTVCLFLTACPMSLRLLVLESGLELVC